MRTNLALAAVVLLAANGIAEAPLERVWVSPAASISHTIGTTEVAIAYHRPAVKGRTIFGGLVPYGEVWRTGANDATTIRFEDPVEIDGRAVPAGTYSFFAIPEQNAWTLILNKQAKQWGAYSYAAAQDQLRWRVVPKASSAEEWLSYAIDPIDADSARVRLRWEKLEVAFTVDVDVRGLMLAQIDRAIAAAKPEDWQTYLQAARYYHDADHDLPRALAWIDASIAAQESFWNLDLKARLLHKTEQDALAIPVLEKAIRLAREKQAPAAYVDGLSKLLGELTAR